MGSSEGGESEKPVQKKVMARLCMMVRNGNKNLMPVGSFEPNEFELYDMTGNAWEWCWDWYDEAYYKNSPKRNPQWPSSGNSRVVRGGAWNNKPNNVRAANRNNETPDNSNNNNNNGGGGFRLSKIFLPESFLLRKKRASVKVHACSCPVLKTGQRGEKSWYGVDTLERYRDFFP